MTYPGVIFWICAIWVLCTRGPAVYYFFFLSWSFGTLAVLPASSLGNLTPPWIAACILTVRAVLDFGSRRYLEAFFDLRRFGFLGLCTLYAAASAYFLPRMFAGQVDVITMRVSEVAGAVPLRPDGANLTQGLYFIITTLTVISVYLVCQEEGRRRDFLLACAWGGVAAIVTGLADFFASATGLSGLLEPFRNARYALLLDNEVEGMHRVVGLMSEASSYAGLCLPFLSFLVLTASKDSPWGRWRAPLCVGLLLMAYLSTSSSGYVALGALGATLVASLLVGMLEKRRAAWWGGYGVVVAIGTLSAALLLNPTILDPLYHLLDVAVLHKTASDSYIARTTWNRVSYQAFLHTNLLGVGIGGARASSWIYSLLSNIGAPGTALMFLFMAQVVLTPAAKPGDQTLARAAKLALAPSLLIASLAGTSAGFGLGAATFFGLASALCWPEPELPEMASSPHLA